MASVQGNGGRFVTFVCFSKITIQRGHLPNKKMSTPRSQPENKFLREVISNKDLTGSSCVLEQQQLLQRESFWNPQLDHAWSLPVFAYQGTSCLFSFSFPLPFSPSLSFSLKPYLNVLLLFPLFLNLFLYFFSFSFSLLCPLFLNLFLYFSVSLSLYFYFALLVLLSISCSLCYSILFFPNFLSHLLSLALSSLIFDNFYLFLSFSHPYVLFLNPSRSFSLSLNSSIPIRNHPPLGWWFHRALPCYPQFHMVKPSSKPEDLGRWLQTIDIASIHL